LPSLSKGLLGLVALHPLIQQRDVLLLAGHLGERDLMGPPVAFRPLAVHFLGTSPALWRAEDDHRPPRAFCILLSPCLILDGVNLGADGIQSRGHHSVHSFWLASLDEVPIVALSD